MITFKEYLAEIAIKGKPAKGRELYVSTINVSDIVYDDKNGVPKKFEELEDADKEIIVITDKSNNTKYYGFFGYEVSNQIIYDLYERVEEYIPDTKKPDYGIDDFSIASITIKEDDKLECVLNIDYDDRYYEIQRCVVEIDFSLDDDEISFGDCVYDVRVDKN